MPYDGSGVYSLTYTWATEAASPPIAISKLDTEFAGIAAGLSLCILRNGNGKPTANIDWNAQKITNLGNATADADALNRVTADGRYARVGSNETVTGAWTFTTNPTVTNVEPALWLNETDAGSNEKVWRWVAAAGALYLQTMTDALAPGANVLGFTRSGTTPGSMTYNGNTVWHSGNDGASSGLDADTLDGVHASALVPTSDVTSGSFTMYLRATHNGANLTSGTAYWKKFNGVVSLSIPELYVTGTQTTLYVENLPAAIQAGGGHSFPVLGWDGSGVMALLRAYLSTDNFNLTTVSAGAFTSASAQKGIASTTITYVP